MKNSFLIILLLLCSTVVHAQLKIGETPPEIELMGKAGHQIHLYRNYIKNIKITALKFLPCRLMLTGRFG
jgi:hypothetical protein